MPSSTTFQQSALKAFDSELQITTASLPDAVNGTPYSQQLAATGGIKPYTFSLFSGAFPAGITMSASGLISGTPTESASFGVVIQVTDAG